MGIKDLNKFLSDKYPNVFSTVHIRDFAFKRIAVDFSLYLFLLISRHSYPDNPSRQRAEWLRDFIYFIECFRKNNVHAVFIYDNFEAHNPEKEEERKERRENKEKSDMRISELYDALLDYKNTNIVPDILKKFAEDRKISPVKRLLGSKTDDGTTDMRQVEYAIEKMRKNNFSITPQDFELTKQLFTILNVPFTTAPMEAETMCSDLCKRGLVDAVMSRDSDVLAYGATIFLSDLDVRTETAKQVKYADVLAEIGLTDEQFLDFCIMCSCDYNDRIKNIGPVKAFNMIKTHEKIENIPNVDPTPLKHELCRKKFREYEKINYVPPYCGDPDFNELAKFLFTYHIKTDLERIKKSFDPVELVFEE